MTMRSLYVENYADKIYSYMMSVKDSHRLNTRCKNNLYKFNTYELGRVLYGYFMRYERNVGRRVYYGLMRLVEKGLIRIVEKRRNMGRRYSRTVYIIEFLDGEG